jgi:hypothetical protein
MTGWEQCELCGIVGNPDAIGVRIVAWANPDQHGGKPYGAVSRCRDSQACRDRYEVGGKVWPIQDTTSPSLPAAIKFVGQPMAVAASTHVSQAEPSPAHDDAEVAAWLR